MIQTVNSNIYPDFPNLVIDFDRKIELYMDSLNGFSSYSKSFKIFYLNETVGVQELKYWLIENYHLFDLIITHHQDILNSCPNSHLLVRGTTWIQEFDLNSKKEFSISNLAGEKNMLFGHKLRNQIHYKQEKINIPKNFFVGNRPGSPEAFDGNKVLVAEKNPMYTSQFNFAFENIKQDNWFTEKLIDCFVTKTIPIYYGCPNIEKWFNMDGIIVINTLQEAIDAANSLTEETYKNKLEAVEDNFLRAQQYKTVDDRLRELLICLIKNPQV